MPMQVQRGGRGIAPTHLQTRTRRRRVSSNLLGCFTLGKSQYPLYRILSGSQDQSGWHVKSFLYQDSIPELSSL